MSAALRVFSHGLTAGVGAEAGRWPSPSHAALPDTGALSWEDHIQAASLLSLPGTGCALPPAAVEARGWRAPLGSPSGSLAAAALGLRSPGGLQWGGAAEDWRRRPQRLEPVATFQPDVPQPRCDPDFGLSVSLRETSGEAQSSVAAGAESPLASPAPDEGWLGGLYSWAAQGGAEAAASPLEGSRDLDSGRLAAAPEAPHDLCGEEQSTFLAPDAAPASMASSCASQRGAGVAALGAGAGAWGSPPSSLSEVAREASPASGAAWWAAGAGAEPRARCSDLAPELPASPHEASAAPTSPAFPHGAPPGHGDALAAPLRPSAPVSPAASEAEAACAAVSSGVTVCEQATAAAGRGDGRGLAGDDELQRRILAWQQGERGRVEQLERRVEAQQEADRRRLDDLERQVEVLQRVLVGDDAAQSRQASEQDGQAATPDVHETLPSGSFEGQGMGRAELQNLLVAQQAALEAAASGLESLREEVDADRRSALQFGEVLRSLDARVGVEEEKRQVLANGLGQAEERLGAMAEMIADVRRPPEDPHRSIANRLDRVELCLTAASAESSAAAAEAASATEAVARVQGELSCMALRLEQELLRCDAQCRQRVDEHLRDLRVDLQGKFSAKLRRLDEQLWIVAEHLRREMDELEGLCFDAGARATHQRLSSASALRPPVMEPIAGPLCSGLDAAGAELLGGAGSGEGIAAAEGDRCDGASGAHSSAQSSGGTSIAGDDGVDRVAGSPAEAPDMAQATSAPEPCAARDSWHSHTSALRRLSAQGVLEAD